MLFPLNAPNESAPTVCAPYKPLFVALQHIFAAATKNFNPENTDGVGAVAKIQRAR